MQNRYSTAGIAATILLVPALPAIADVTITQQADPAPTYDTTLNFDEDGGPTGANVGSDAWLASHGISEFISGAGGNFVGDLTGAYAWLPDSSNMYEAPFGAFMTFVDDMTEFSVQAWDNSGPSSPFGGGMGIGVYNDGDEVAFTVFDPAWGGLGDSWFDITTTDGSTFDEVRILGFGFAGPVTVVDNMSWNTVPGPGVLAAMAVGLLGGRRRRRIG